MNDNKKRLLLLSLLISTATFNSEAGELQGWDEGAKYLIMADPQAWRMGQGSGSPDPNSPKTAEPWRKFNHQVVDGINNKVLGLKARFGIINGDITEFGRKSQLDSFYAVYDRLMLPVYLGLGNHDYENNINDCARPEVLNFSMNACAYHMVKHLTGKMDEYREKLKNFSADSIKNSNHVTRGSQAYSWDDVSAEGGTSHFVQLHLGPNYRVFINNLFKSHNFDITDSLSWLREDLERARRRGVNHIFINFHALEWINKASAQERKVLKAIIDEYRVSAVFVGHTHYPSLSRYTALGDVPVYTTGALYSGYFDILNVKKDSFQVQSYQVINGTPRMIAERDELAKPAPPPACYKPGATVPQDGFVRTEFIPDQNKTFILKQRETANALDANASGEIYTNKLNTFNPYMHWKLQHYSTTLDNRKYYKVIHVKDNKVLDGDARGNIYTKKPNGGHYQQWEIVKYSNGGVIQLRSRATGRLLDANTRKEVYGTKNPLNFNNDNQNWELINLNGSSVPNIRYFRAKASDSFTKPLPTGNNSNEYWEYAGERATDLAAPCI